MNITDYQDIIQKTAVYPKEFGPAYTVLGLVGELGELSEALEQDVEVQSQEDFDKLFLNIKKEGGDVYWYITATCNEYGIPLEQVFVGWLEDYATGKTDFHMKEALVYAANVAELTKKVLRDKNIDLEEMTMQLNMVYLNVNNILLAYGYSLGEILQSNYDKLIKRRETGTLHGSGDHREEETQGEK